MRDTVPPPPQYPEHMQKCIALMYRYMEQGRSSASIGRMLKAVGAERYMNPSCEVYGPVSSMVPVWTLRGFMREYQGTSIGYICPVTWSTDSGG